MKKKLSKGDIMFEKVVSMLRSEGGSIILNKNLIKNVGMEAAAVYSELVSKYGYFKKRNQLTDDGYFFNTIEDLQKDTGLTEYLQRKAIKKLESFGLIKVELRGLPSKRYFKLNWDLKVLNIALGISEVTLKNLGSDIKSFDISTQKNLGNDTKKLQTNNTNITILKKNTNIIREKQVFPHKTNKTISNKLTKTEEVLEKENKGKVLEKEKIKKKPYQEIMIESFSENEKIREKLLEYFTLRVKKGLREVQWKIMLEDLKNYTSSDLEIINSLNTAISGSYMTIIPKWEKDKIIKRGGLNKFNEPTQKRRILTEEERKISTIAF